MIMLFMLSYFQFRKKRSERLRKGEEREGAVKKKEKGRREKEVRHTSSLTFGESSLNEKLIYSSKGRVEG
jgi:hypothetical protein